MRHVVILGLALALGACSNGNSSTPLPSSPPELLACRARYDSPHQFAEIALRSARNLGSARVGDKTGAERHARLHPQDQRVVFARERTANDPNSNELFVSSIDGSSAELRLTTNSSYDAWPCWSPDGASVLFVSERAGPRSLWLMSNQGGEVRALLTPPSGSMDDQPDWASTGSLVAFSRGDASGLHRIHIGDASGTGSIAITDGGSAAPGDGAPRFSPDGSELVFVRRTSAGASLCRVATTGGTVTQLFSVVGDLDFPTYAPTSDRWYFGIEDLAAGHAGLRLAWWANGDASPTLAWPDRRWLLGGLDLLPTMPPHVAPSWQTVDVLTANLQLAIGTNTAGSQASLVQSDQDELRIMSATSDGREVAGINLRCPLPTGNPADLLGYEITIQARALRGGADCYLRSSLYNAVEERFDTAIELGILDTTMRTLRLRADSLRHVTRENQLRFTVIADLAPGEPAELAVDAVALRCATQAN